MKKIISVLLVFLIAMHGMAQYKKASFFGKQGRTYELGTQLYALGNGQGNPVGFKIAFGRDRDGKQFFSSWELQYVPSFKYSYTTTQQNTNMPVKVDGTARPMFIYGVNYAFHVLKNDDPERKVKPFVFFGFDIVLSGGIKSETTSPEQYDLTKQTEWPDFQTGLMAGAGTLVNLNQKFGLRLQAGYEYAARLNAYDQDSPETFKLFGSHPFVSLGFRYRLVSE